MAGCTRALISPGGSAMQAPPVVQLRSRFDKPFAASLVVDCTLPSSYVEVIVEMDRGEPRGGHVGKSHGEFEGVGVDGDPHPPELSYLYSS